MELSNYRFPADRQAGGATVLAHFDLVLGDIVIRRCSYVEYPDHKRTIWGPRGGEVVFAQDLRKSLSRQAQAMLERLQAAPAGPVRFGDLADAA